MGLAMHHAHVPDDGVVACRPPVAVRIPPSPPDPAADTPASEGRRSALPVSRSSRVIRNAAAFDRSAVAADGSHPGFRAIRPPGGGRACSVVRAVARPAVPGGATRGWRGGTYPWPSAAGNRTDDFVVVPGPGTQMRC